MSEHVKQHYVPQFYFRNFARDERVCAYNLDNEEGYPPTPISNICYENYFYGDSEEEKHLSKLESEFASVIHSIVDQISLEPIKTDPQAMHFLDLFISHTEARTKAAREESSEFTQEFLELAIEIGVESGELDSEHLEMVRNDEIRLEGPDHEQRQLMSFYGPFYFADLHRVLIWNGTNRDFITSDHPVVFDNSRFKNEIEMNPVGYSATGLQVFCPLSNNLLLLLFDPMAYRVDANSNHTVIIKDEVVVEELNKLQPINCLENCYYRDEPDKDWIDELYHDVKEYRPDESVRREHQKVYDSEKGREREFVFAGNPTIEFSPELPFVTEVPTAQFSPLRNVEWHQTVREMYEEELESAKEMVENEDSTEDSK